MKFKYKILLLMACLPYLLYGKADTIDLTKTKWALYYAKEDVWLPAKVPGTVQTDLWLNKKIDNPYIDLNEKALRWTEDLEWRYKTVFDVPEDYLSKRFIQIAFHGLDTFAEVSLNGTKIITANNAFRLWEKEVKSLLKEKGNVLEVVFRPVSKVLSDINRNSEEFLPPANWGWIRKPRYHFGWGGGPDILISGIWKGVELNAWDVANMEELFVRQKELTATLATLTADIKIRSEDVKKITLELEGNFGEKLIKQVVLKKGMNNVQMDMEIKNPKWWWCNGWGEQHLYALKVNMKDEKNSIDTEETRFGLRNMEWLDAGGRLAPKLNGQPIYLKGANIVPLDFFTPSVQKEDYDRLVQSLVESNINMVRIWGGGMYESKYFYDLCDEKGIMIWQDLMFSDGVYPGTNDFLDNVRLELADNIKRLRQHPSIVAWCGNDNVEELWFKGYMKKRFNLSEQSIQKIEQWQIDLFQNKIPEWIEAFDSTRTYFPSTTLANNTIVRIGTDWNVWEGHRMVEHFQENDLALTLAYGMQSFPSERLMNTYISPKEKNTNPNAFLARQRQLRGFRNMDYYLNTYMPHYKSSSEKTYLSTVLQSYILKKAYTYLRLKNNHKSSGSLFWHLNDLWPGISHSTIDYDGRWKAAQHQMKKSYSRVHAGVNKLYNDGINVQLFNDDKKHFKGQVLLHYFDSSGDMLYSEEIDVHLKAGESRSIRNLPPYISKPLYRDLNNLIIQTKVLDLYDNIVFDDTHFLTKPKALTLTEPNVSIQEIAPNTFEIKSDVPTLYVELSVDAAVQYAFSDNYFSLLPNEVKTIKIHSTSSFHHDDIKVKSLNNSLHKKNQ